MWRIHIDPRDDVAATRASPHTDIFYKVGSIERPDRWCQNSAWQLPNNVFMMAALRKR